LLILGGVSGSRPARAKSSSSKQRRIAIAYDNARALSAVMSTASMIRSIRRTYARIQRNENSVSLIGRLTCDPEIRSIESGDRVAHLLGRDDRHMEGPSRRAPAAQRPFTRSFSGTRR
jgi:hypothetical protein